MLDGHRFWVVLVLVSANLGFALSMVALQLGLIP